MAYFVTGATGFIGSNLVPLLLRRASQQADADAEIHLLVRESSRARLEDLIDEWTHETPRARSLIKPVVGDLLEPLLGVTPDTLGWLSARSFTHFFHLAALYDLTADEELNRLTNVEGTTNALTLAGELGARHFHHVSSIAVAGGYRGTFAEEMFDVGQPLEHAYQRTKFEAERLVREASPVPWRIYRPSVVIGDSRTGRIDKIDGPYYLFPLLKRAHQVLPTWLPLLGPELGSTNIVPVDYVVRALDHIAHRRSLDRRTFHLVQASPQRVVDVINIFAQVAEAPQLALTVDAGPLASVPKAAAQAAMWLPGARSARRSLLVELGIPEELLAFTGLTASFGTEGTEKALAGSGIEPPPLRTYADRIWHYWARHLDPDLSRHSDIDSAVTGKTVLITGASSGIGRATAVRLARSGATVLLVARGAEQLEETRSEIASDGGVAHAYTADISRPESIDELVTEVLAEHPQIDILVNNAGRSIRRSIELSYDRFHDFERTMQLNYLGTIRLIMGLLPAMRSRRSGHVINISSIGVQTSPPRFSAYVASKSALDAWTRVVSSECVADHVYFTTIHMPLVRTPMIAPTKLYDRFPTISPEQAAEMVAEAIRTQPKTVGTTLGTFGEVSYALFPKLVDQVLSTAYRVFPDSPAARGDGEPDSGDGGPASERASAAQTVFARLMRGVHW